jgi:ATPase subunit of ABC transporter with duplicated ATPase domains
MASPQYVYVMNKLSKTYPGGKQVLKDITLAFLPGAKIGVVGLNGAGKSTLLRIMAGEEKEFLGEAWAADGVTVGFLSQEPQLDPAKDVTGNVMEGVAEKKAKLDRYNELAMNYSDETADEMAKLQDEIDAGNLWDLDAQVDDVVLIFNKFIDLFLTDRQTQFIFCLGKGNPELSPCSEFKTR